MEGGLVLGNLDIVQAAGVSTAFIVPVQTKVSDGFATIELVGVVKNPSIANGD